ncbi:unnamed protein product [Darwinula stevensoni]|uniref:START domain-containing protein n=1 Tax=Darwinula stevensoni TaxID=69355 RepID=A0A7R8XFP7_9CRUS|nr:unnamed protein product [Darwinula stevensoni]CAG0895563.1 unnamed protein product [Darwinula stevensoni]
MRVFSRKFTQSFSPPPLYRLADGGERFCRGTYRRVLVAFRKNPHLEHGGILNGSHQINSLLLQRISKTKMIAHVIGAHLGSQYISRRDFVAVYSRHGVLDTQRMVEDFYMCFISTEFPGAPREGEYVRATYHSSGFRFSPNGDGFATFQYLLNVDVKINALMKALSRVAMIPTMAEYATQLRNYASTLKKA